MSDADLNFDGIYENHATKVLNMCYRMTGNEQTARDIAQDIWIKVYQNLSKFRGDSAVSTWIYRITVNHVLNHFKKEKRRRWREILNLDIRDGLKEYTGVLEVMPDSNEPNPSDSIQQKEREKIVWNCIRKLPENQRVPLFLFRYEDMSYQEISKILEISLKAVESRLHRAKLKLQKLLEPHLEEI